jgi:DNA-binding response OmpR family regulator
MTQDIARTETILIVDDEQNICTSLREVLAYDGHRALSATNGATALQILAREAVDLIVLDLNMPEMNGLELVHIIHEQWPLTVIVILTGYGTLDSALSALRHGVHDYLLKPASPDEIKSSIRRGLEKRQRMMRRNKLLTRIEDNVRELAQDRIQGNLPLEPLGESMPPAVIRTDNLVIELPQHRAMLNRQELDLTPIEFNTLVVLVKNRERVMSYTSIVQETHGYACSKQEARALIKTHISHLRQKLEFHTQNPCPIVNIRGVGYMWSDAQIRRTTGAEP